VESLYNILPREIASAWKEAAKEIPFRNCMLTIAVNSVDETLCLFNTLPGQPPSHPSFTERKFLTLLAMSGKDFLLWLLLLFSGKVPLQDTQAQKEAGETLKLQTMRNTGLPPSAL
jgi:hypothetical protein